MNEHSTKEDLEAARDRITVQKEDLEQARDAIIARIDTLDAEHRAGMEGFRQQQSAEHGSIYGMMRSVLDGVNWLKAKWINFSKL